MNEAFQHRLEGSQRTSRLRLSQLGNEIQWVPQRDIWMPGDRTKACGTRQAQPLPLNAFTRRGTSMLFKPQHCAFPWSVKFSVFISKATDLNLNFILVWHSCWILGKTLSDLDYIRTWTEWCSEEALQAFKKGRCVYFYPMCMSVLSLCMYAYHIPACSPKSLVQGTGSLELELQITVNHNSTAGESWVLCILIAKPSLQPNILLKNGPRKDFCGRQLPFLQFVIIEL